MTPRSVCEALKSFMFWLNISIIREEELINLKKWSLETFKILQFYICSTKYVIKIHRKTLCRGLVFTIDAGLNPANSSKS